MVLAIALAVSACGAKTPLDVPDIQVLPDVARADVLDAFRPPRCVDGHFALIARAADVILVIDRSGSMAQSLDGQAAGRGNSKWEILRDALASTLPLFQDRLGVGALFFPAEGVNPRGVSSCTVGNVPQVDVDPALDTADRIVSMFDSTAPAGATPTAAALLRAYTYFVRHPDRARAHYLVLATDGGPNCNTTLDTAVCVCTSPRRAGTSLCGGARDGTTCLDDVRTIREIAQIASNAITPMATFVVGLAGHSDPVYAATLSSMAVAGGRPVVGPDGAATFYNVERAGDLAVVFASIENAIARCSFLTPSRPADPDALVLAVDGAVVPRDASHTNGWDWTDAVYGEVTLFGAACVTASARAVNVTATVVCDGDAG